MRQFEDPWNRFARTGRIEDYLSYRSRFDCRVVPASSENNIPDISVEVALSSRLMDTGRAADSRLE